MQSVVFQVCLQYSHHRKHLEQVLLTQNEVIFTKEKSNVENYL